jgi:hypothetical protein
MAGGAIVSRSPAPTQSQRIDLRPSMTIRLSPAHSAILESRIFGFGLTALALDRPCRVRCSDPGRGRQVGIIALLYKFLDRLHQYGGCNALGGARP